MTIDELNALATLTAGDEIPVWDAEASGEPTKKITAQNMANSVKSLASLPNTTEMNTAIAQSTAMLGVSTQILGATSGTGEHTLSQSFGKYRYVLMVAFNGISIYTSIIPSNLLIAAGYELSIMIDTGAVASVKFTNATTVNIISNPNTIRLYGIQ